MTRTRVVILSSRSLFTEGIANRLRQHAEQFEVHHVDSRQADALDQVVSTQPSTVIIDASDEELSRRYSLGAIVDALPAVKIIRLDPQQEHVQVVASQQRQAGEVRDLIDLIAENH